MVVELFLSGVFNSDVFHAFSTIIMQLMMETSSYNS